ncbi:MAG: hypothetical protein M3281_04080 [Chloroflexota bacterium]|nr:hypothetical protein [Chloroflexota bacterium]
MPSGAELYVALPLFDVAASALRTTGAYDAELSSEDLSQAMRVIAQSLLSSQSLVRATVPEASLRIQDTRGTAVTAVRVESPVQALVRLNIVLGNATTPGRLQLEKLDLREEGSIAAKFAMRALNVEGRVRHALSDPNQALLMALETQMSPRQVRISELALHLGETSLSVRMRGGPLP